MHLKSYPKLVRSELRLDAASVQTLSQQSNLFVSHQGALLRTCSSNHGNNNNSSSRLPFNVISSNTLQLKAPPSTGLQLLPPPPGYENNVLRLYQTTTEDADAPLDIWTVIKPGHVREKIAIFASDGGRTIAAGHGECTSTGGPGGRDRTPSVCTSHATMSGLLRAVKAKGSWEENSSAKRRRRSGNNQNFQPDQRIRVLDTQQQAHKLSPRCPDSTQRSGDGRFGGEAMTAAEEEEQKVSVVEMVAFLEQRVSEQQPDSKPLLTLQRSSTTITLSRAPSLEVKEGSEVRGEEPESIRVSDMVAKLESECLRRRSEGLLSRNNSLRRTVGRVLLATRDQISAPCQPSSSSSSSSSSLPGAQSAGREPMGGSETPRTETPASTLTTPPSPSLTTTLLPPSGEAADKGQEAEGGRGPETPAPPPTETTALQTEETEPLPGLLFLSVPPAASETLPHTDSTPSPTDSKPCPPFHRMTLEPALPQPRLPPACSNSGSQSEKKRRRKADKVQEEVGGATPNSAAVPLGRRASVSNDFLEMRQRLQQLLEPQPYLAVLPHHLLVKIFLLLPTQSLAALKCTCHYFQFIIDNYSVRPADSLWVSDPRYRDDPCKQCKKRYGRGDVSLCRWHHKPYCQALPYGPGYWMCCHGAHRDTPGCNVGLHDNRWVPAFHSINVPIYRKSQDDD